MTIDEPQIKQLIREYLQKNPHSGATVLHRWVFEHGKGNFGETAIWKVIKSMAKSGELEEDVHENGRKFYSLGDITRDISEKLDVLVQELESVREKLNEFHDQYSSPKSQTKTNYLMRLMDLTTITRELLGAQSYVFLVEGFPDFKTHKSMKNINKTLDQLWQSVRANAFHQSGNDGKFLQELIWSLRPIKVQKMESYSGFK